MQRDFGEHESREEGTENIWEKANLNRQRGAPEGFGEC